MNRPGPQLLTLVLAWLGASVAFAADRFELCPCFGPDLPELPPLAQGAPASAVADSVRYDGSTIELWGDVHLQRQDQRLLGERARYTLVPETIELDGGLRYWDTTRILFARSGRFHPDQHTGHLESVRFWFPQAHLAGESVRAERQGPDRDRLDQVRLSTCPPNKRDWVVEAERVDLDHDRGRGVAQNATLRFKGLPLLYAPWLDFPLDDRRASGFLYPSAGMSSQRGFELSIPYYWNIAPERDATFTFRPMSKRGLMLQAEYRQLWRQGRGQINLDWLPHDNEDGRSHRYLLDAHTVGSYAGWNTSIALRRASDMDFKRDFSLTKLGNTIDYLESHARASRQFGSWNLMLNAQQWQTLSYNVSEVARPYRRLPQILLRGSESLGPLDFTLDTEVVRFRHDYAPKLQGERYSARPALALPIQASWYSITPRLALDSVHYRLDGARYDRTGPIASLDTRLFFDRYGENLHQQLEPRLYYLYVPYRAQTGLPLFDTGPVTPSLGNLFIPNRYNGRDRLGDTHALSYALTWRALDAREGYERANLAVGQRYRFADERVALDGEVPRPSGPGEIIGEAGLGLNPNWRLRLTFATTPERNTLAQTYSLLSYRGADQRLFNLHYARHEDDPGLPDLEQVGMSFAWLVHRQWRVLGSLVKDLMENRIILALVGVEYDSCCWRLRLAGRQEAVDTAQIDRLDTDTTVFVQLELKGLGGLGQQADRQFERAILGFHAP